MILEYFITEKSKGKRLPPLVPRVLNLLTGFQTFEQSTFELVPPNFPIRVLNELS